MRDKYTYQFPKSEAFIYTLRRYLELNGEKKLSELLQDATCEFSNNGQYSIRSDVYQANIVFFVLLENFELFNEDHKNKLLRFADKIFPRNAGYDLEFIEISPSLTVPPHDGVLAGSLGTHALHLARFEPVWGDPGIDDKYASDVFMIMPFRPGLQEVYTKIVKPTVEGLGLSIKRGDDPFTNKDIMFDVWSMLNACKLVIADCTGLNPNVFYELGIAHTLGKPVIMLTQDLSKLPFDVQSKRAIEYNTAFDHIDRLQSQLQKSVLSILPSAPPPNVESVDADERPF